MASVLLSVGELANVMQQKPVTLVRALMDDPVSKTPDTRTAMVLPASVDFDLDSEGSDHTTGLPHSMPSANDLANSEYTYYGIRYPWNIFCAKSVVDVKSVGPPRCLYIKWRTACMGKSSAAGFRTTTIRKINLSSYT